MKVQSILALTTVAFASTNVVDTNAPYVPPPPTATTPAVLGYQQSETNAPSYGGSTTTPAVLGSTQYSTPIPYCDEIADTTGYQQIPADSYNSGNSGSSDASSSASTGDSSSSNSTDTSGNSTSAYGNDQTAQSTSGSAKLTVTVGLTAAIVSALLF